MLFANSLTYSLKGRVEFLVRLKEQLSVVTGSVSNLRSPNKSASCAPHTIQIIVTMLVTAPHNAPCNFYNSFDSLEEVIS